MSDSLTVLNNLASEAKTFEEKMDERKKRQEEISKVKYDEASRLNEESQKTLDSKVQLESNLSKLAEDYKKVEESLDQTVSMSSHFNLLDLNDVASAKEAANKKKAQIIDRFNMQREVYNNILKANSEKIKTLMSEKKLSDEYIKGLENKQNGLNSATLQVKDFYGKIYQDIDKYLAIDPLSGNKEVSLATPQQEEVVENKEEVTHEEYKPEVKEEQVLEKEKEEETPKAKATSLTDLLSSDMGDDKDQVIAISTQPDNKYSDYPYLNEMSLSDKEKEELMEEMSPEKYRAIMDTLERANIKPEAIPSHYQDFKNVDDIDNLQLTLNTLEAVGKNNDELELSNNLGYILKANNEDVRNNQLEAYARGENPGGLSIATLTYNPEEEKVKVRAA